MVAASGILATVIPFGQSVGDSMDLPRCFATLRLPCQARRRPSSRVAGAAGGTASQSICCVGYTGCFVLWLLRVCEIALPSRGSV